MKTIVCLGDSITDNRDRPSYVDFWQAMEKAEIHGAGVNGETAFDGLQRFDTDVTRYKPDLVTICFGHNEVHLGVPVFDYEQYMSQLIEKVLEIQADCWLLTPTQIAEFEMTELDGRLPDRYIPYLESLRKIAKKYSCHLVDLWHVFDDYDLKDIFTYEFDYDGLVGRDYLHPNELGQKIIAERLGNEYKLMYQSNK